MVRVAVGQMGTCMFNTPATLVRVEAACRAASASGARLLVLPEALIGGYPKGLHFGTVVGSRSPAGRDLYARYNSAAIRCPGAEAEVLAALCLELQLHLVIGVVEREGTTLYCTSLLFTPDRGLAAKHRKLVPTGAERVIWASGDGSTMQVTETAVGRIGMAICWESYMPLYRQHLYNQGTELLCIPTVDTRDTWQASMRHIACEGRCFVLSACQQLAAEDWPEDLQHVGGSIDGHSVVVSPLGVVLAGPQHGAGLLTTEVDLDDVVRGRFDLDVAGHYSRPDVFDVRVR